MDGNQLRTSPAERFEGPVVFADLHAELAALRAETYPARQGHRQKAIYKHGGRTVAVFVMDDGATFHEHSAGGVVTLQSLEGTVIVNVEGDERSVGPGQLIAMRPNAKHSVRAVGAAAFLLEVSLAPASDR